MKIKTLSFAILSSVLLSACGSSDNNTAENINDSKISDQTWTSFTLYGDDQARSLDFESDIQTINNSKYYVKKDIDIGESFFITADGVYGDGPEHPKYGFLLGSVSGSYEQLKLSYYSPVGSKGMEESMSHKIIDISGKSLVEILNPTDAFSIKNNFNTNQISKTLLQFYAENETEKFPAGSSCSVLTQQSTNQNYIEIDKSTKDLPSNVDIWKSESQKVASETIKKLFKDTTAYFIEDSNSSEYDIYAQYQNSIYAGNYFEKGINFDLLQEIKDDKSELNENSNLTAERRKLAIEQADLKSTTCTSYNETASKTIHNAINAFE